VTEGIADFKDTKLTTIFSAANYGGRSNNAGGMVTIKEDGT
jgi:hypothetical protein